MPFLPPPVTPVGNCGSWASARWAQVRRLNHWANASVPNRRCLCWRSDSAVYASDVAVKFSYSNACAVAAQCTFCLQHGCMLLQLSSWMSAVLWNTSVITSYSSLPLFALCSGAAFALSPSLNAIAIFAPLPLQFFCTFAQCLKQVELITLSRYSHYLKNFL